MFDTKQKYVRLKGYDDSYLYNVDVSAGIPTMINLTLNPPKYNTRIVTFS